VPVSDPIADDGAGVHALALDLAFDQSERFTQITEVPGQAAKSLTQKVKQGGRGA
jgi:hypothetical protein